MTRGDGGDTRFASCLQDDEELVARYETRSDTVVDAVLQRLLSVGQVSPAEYSIGVTDRAYLFVGTDGDRLRHPRDDLRSSGFDKLTVPTGRLAIAGVAGLLLCLIAVFFRMTGPYLSFLLWTVGVVEVMLVGITYNCLRNGGLVLFRSETRSGDVVQMPVSSDVQSSLEQYTTQQANGGSSPTSLPVIRSVVWGDHSPRAIGVVLCGAVLATLFLAVAVGQQPRFVSWQPDYAGHFVPHVILVTATAVAVWRNWGIVPAYSLSVVPVYAIALYNCCLISRFFPIGVFPAPSTTFAMDLLVTAGWFWIGGVVLGSVLRTLETGFRMALGRDPVS